MTDPIDTLLLDVRANTQGFAADLSAMRSAFDGTLVDGMGKAGEALERGLLGAIRKGSLGFEDLRRIALNVIDQIAAQALQGLFCQRRRQRRQRGGAAQSGQPDRLGPRPARPRHRRASLARARLSGGRARPGTVRADQRRAGRGRADCGTARRPRFDHHRRTARALRPRKPCNAPAAKSPAQCAGR